MLLLCSLKHNYKNYTSQHRFPDGLVDKQCFQEFGVRVQAGALFQKIELKYEIECCKAEKSHWDLDVRCVKEHASSIHASG